MQCWLSDTHTRLLLVQQGPNVDQGINPNYIAFIAQHPNWFTEVAQLPTYNYVLYRVDVPKPAAADCATATKAARA
jgi:hypothetical protein